MQIREIIMVVAAVFCRAEQLEKVIQNFVLNPDEKTFIMNIVIQGCVCGAS
jgi:hypothetical protein